MALLSFSYQYRFQVGLDLFIYNEIMKYWKKMLFLIANVVRKSHQGVMWNSEMILNVKNVTVTIKSSAWQ